MNEKITFIANELFMAICHRTPLKEEVKYFEELGKPSTNPPITSSQCHVNRVSLCQDNPNAKKFNDIYQQLHLANIKELEPFILLLESIKRSPSVLEMLRINAEIEGESEQVNSSNTRRNQLSIDSISHHNKDWKSKKSSVISCSSTKNKYQTLDFIDLSDIPSCQKEFSSLDLLDKTEQENALIQDLVCCLMGCSGLYVRPLPLINATDRQFLIDPTIYPSYSDTVKKIVSVAANISTVAKFIDVYSAYEYGTVNQALASAMNQQLREVRLLVCQMQDQWLAGDLNLTLMMRHLQDPGQQLVHMARICSDIQQARCRGGAILSLIGNLNPSIGSSKHKELLKYLMHAASYPFFRALKLWIYRGIIYDDYEEFFIRADPRHQVHKSSNLNENSISPKFWTDRYTIESKLVPRFLELYVDKILNTGKYLNVVQLCGSDIEFPVIEDMVYEIEDCYYITQIDRAYDYASKLLLNIMFEKMKLKDHFKFMKHYFLLYEADWLNFFMDLANDELNEIVTDSKIGRLESLLDVAIQSRSSVSDSLKDSLKVELSNQELIPFIFHVMSFKPENKRINPEIVGKNLRVLEAFTLHLTTEWPISLVFHSAVMQRYQILFRHLFYCHHVARVLSSVWLMKKSNQKNSYTNRLVNKANALGGRMHNFIRDLLYYMTTEVIEPFWNVFESKLDQSQNIDEVFGHHDNFLQSCLSNCMLNSKNMLKNLHKMMVLCVNYTNRFNRLMGGSDTDRILPGTIIPDLVESKSFEDIINQDDVTFNGIMRDLIRDITENERDNKKLLNLAERMEYNYSYYHRSSDSDVDVS